MRVVPRIGLQDKSQITRAAWIKSPCRERSGKAGLEPSDTNREGETRVNHRRRRKRRDVIETRLQSLAWDAVRAIPATA